MRKFVIGLLVSLLLLASVPALANSAIRIVINGQEVKPSVSPVLVQGNVMVPLRFLAEQFDAKVQWNPQTNMITVEKLDTSELLLKLAATKTQEIENWILLCVSTNYDLYNDFTYEKYQKEIREIIEMLRSSTLFEPLRESQIKWMADLSAKLVECNARAHTLEYIRSKQ